MISLLLRPRLAGRSVLACAVLVLAGSIGPFAAPLRAADCVASVPDSLLAVPGELSMATSPTSPPMQYVDGTGKLKGMRIDLGTEIARRLCLKPNFISMDFAPMIPALQAGRFDMLDTGLFYTEERAKTIIYIPNEYQAFSISVPKGNPGGITSLDDLQGKTVSTEFGSYADKKLRSIDETYKAKGEKGFDLKSLENLAVSFQAMRAGQVDAVLSVDPAAYEYQQRGMSERALSGLFPITAGLGFKNRELAGKVLLALQSMKADGSYDKLLASYGVAPFDAPFALKGGAQ